MKQLRFDGFYMCLPGGFAHVLIFFEQGKVIYGELMINFVSVPVREHLLRFEKRFNSKFFDDLNWERRSKYIGGDSYHLGTYSIEKHGKIYIEIIDDEDAKMNRKFNGFIKIDSLDLQRVDRYNTVLMELFEFAAFSDSYLQS